MLADDHHAVHGQRLLAAAKSLGDGRSEMEAELRRPRGALVPHPTLIDIRGDDLQRRPLPATLPRIAEEESVAHMLRVREVPPHRCDYGDAFRLRSHRTPTAAVLDSE